MIRNNFLIFTLIGILSVMPAAPVAVFAQPAPNPATDEGGTAPQSFSQAQLDQMLAPIALYPDSLLAQILLASTYPSQVVEADRWVKSRKGWSKARINAALDKKNWDLSVKALVPFPKVLAMMDKRLEWTTNLGEAFLGRQAAVMASVQQLRHKAYARGNLKTTPQQDVVVRRQDIEIEPANPELVYVPYYDPWQVYGDWGWPGYPPYAFDPYGGAYIGYGLLGFAAGIAVGSYWNRGWGHWNWHDRDVAVNVNRHVNINDPRAGISRSTLRTTNFNTFAQNRAAGVGGVSGARPGAFNRPSAASVRSGLSGTQTGAARGFNGGRAGVTGNRPATSRGFTGGAQNRNFGGAGNFRGNGFSGANPGHVSPGFAGHGFNGGGFHAAPAFGGGGAHFGGGGFGGGGGHFGGGGFGGGGGHFGGGGHGGGGHR